MQLQIAFKLLLLTSLTSASLLCHGWGEKCTLNDHAPTVQQSRVGLRNSPTYLVEVHNCPMCPVINLHLKCGSFLQALVDPKLLKMETAPRVRCWDEMIPEVLGSIFNSLSFKEKLNVIPLVCKSWGKVVAGSDCWCEIDISEWSKERRSKPRDIDRMIQMLVARSSGSMTKLCVFGLDSDKIFSLIAENGNALRTLRLRRCEISDSIIEQKIGMFSNLTFLELDCSEKITRSLNCLKVIATTCKSLTGLCWRNRHWGNNQHIHMNVEADVIATTMPRLKHLEIYRKVDTKGALRILEGCPELEFLDFSGCWAVKLDDKFFRENFPKLKVRRSRSRFTVSVFVFV